MKKLKILLKVILVVITIIFLPISIKKVVSMKMEKEKGFLSMNFLIVI